MLLLLMSLAFQNKCHFAYMMSLAAANIFGTASMQILCSLSKYQKFQAKFIGQWQIITAERFCGECLR